MKRPDNSDDIIDSREVIDAIAELTAELEETTSEDDAAPIREELRTLTEFAAECEPYSDDWTYGAVIVADSYFETYAKEMVEECGYFQTQPTRFGSPISVDFTAWPYRCIDWEMVAEELKDDYEMVSFGGVDYWVR